MSVGSNELNQPSTHGADYDSEVLENADDPESISTGTESGSLILQAHPDNAGRVFVGWDSDVTSNNGFVLAAGDVLSIDIDLSSQQVFVVANNANDEVRFLVMN